MRLIAEKWKRRKEGQKKAVEVRGHNSSMKTEHWKQLSEEGLKSLAEGLGLDQNELARRFALHVISESKEETGSFLIRIQLALKKNWLELAVSAIVFMLLLLIILRGRVVMGNTVVAARQLEPYHVVTDNDIKLQKGILRYRGYNSPNDIVGRLMLDTVPEGSILESSHLSKYQLSDQEQKSISGLFHISVPVITHTIKMAIPGQESAIMFAPRNNVGSVLRPLVLHDVFVVDVARDFDNTSTIVIAVNETDLEQIGEIIGESDVYLLSRN